MSPCLSVTGRFNLLAAITSLPMNISLLNLVVASSLQGPYLSQGPSRLGGTVTVRNGRFTRFFNSFLYSAAPLGVELSSSTFTSFQNSAILIQAEEAAELVNQTFNETQKFMGSKIEGCLFTECVGAEKGGAVYVDTVSLTVKYSSFFNCSAQTGGALFVTGAWPVSVTIETCCFVGCVGTGKACGYAGEIYGQQVVFSDVSLVDCVSPDGDVGYVILGGANGLKSANVNMSNTIASKCIGGFKFTNVHHQNADVSYHHASGFSCSYLYSFMVETWDDLPAVVRVSHVDVTNLTFAEGDVLQVPPEQCPGGCPTPAVFWTLNSQASSGHIANGIEVSNCNVFGVQGDGTFLWAWYGAKMSASECRSDRDFKLEGVTFTETYTPNELTMNNEEYCYYGPEEPEPETLSDTEDVETSLETDNPEPMDSPSDDEPAIESDSPTEEKTEGGKENDKPLSDGAIAGIVVGILVVIVIIIVIVVILLLRKRPASNDDTKEPDESELDSETVTFTHTTEAIEGLDQESYAPKPSHNIFEVEDMTDPFRNDIEEDRVESSSGGGA